mmetsp:Transcript_16516/g.22828  ORF Transcript_16516/g.22828 Transcript_16516/m.22828 type:complete len:87 (-) Transcript_16516:206-466(-)
MKTVYHINCDRTRTWVASSKAGVLFAAQRPGSSAPALPMTRFFRSHLAQKEEEELSSTFAHQRKEKATEIVFPNTYFGGASMDEDQ